MTREYTAHESQQRDLFWDTEAQVRQAGQEGDFDRQIQLLQQMAEIVETSPGAFDEPNDQGRILQGRARMVEVRRERLHGGHRVADLLHEVSQLNVPSACSHNPCSADPEQCRHFRSALTPRQKKMCWIRITSLIDHYKILAAFASLSFRIDDAVVLRRKTVRLAKLLSELEPSQGDEVSSELTYLEYWLSVSEGVLAVKHADFEPARTCFREARKLGSELPPTKCFPNYFLDVGEIDAHQLYIDALDHLHNGNISDAKDSFNRWLINRPTAKRTLRFDNIKMFVMVCDILTGLQTSSDSIDNWRAAERLLEGSNVARTTWVLWWKLHELRYLRVTNNEDAEAQRGQIEERVKGFVISFWSLFLPDTALLGEDRSAGIKRQVVMFTPLNVFAQLDPRRHNWQRILRQNLRHLLLLMAEYERMRHDDPPPEEVDIPRLSPPVIDELSSLKDLADAVTLYLSRRHGNLADYFSKAIKQIPKLHEAIEKNDFYEAVDIQKEMFDVIRSWPHIIRILEQERIPESELVEEDEPKLLAYRTQVERLWNKQPQTAIFEGPEKLSVGSYYYLRPHWNIRNCDRYRTRHEQFHLARLPQWLDVFTKNLFSSEYVKPQQFHDWILQFREEECLLCCKLFSDFRIYDKSRIVDTWTKVYRQIPASVLRGAVTGDTVFVKLGHGAKSGTLSPYHFRQAISREPEYQVLFRGIEENIFRELSDFETGQPNLSKPRNIVFLDDFIGTGGQATDFVKDYFPKHSWLRDTAVYLCVLTGYKNAVHEIISTIKGAIPGVTFSILVGDMLTERDQAFSEKNPIWASEYERIQAKEWASIIGRELLDGVRGCKPKRDALGYKGCQSLIAFEHNVPNNTLPIFWSTGMRSGKKWIRLFERFA